MLKLSYSFPKIYLKHATSIAALFLLFCTISCQKEVKESQEIGEVHKIVPEMPYIKSDACEEISLKNRKKCSDQELLKFIYGNVKYPKLAKENETEGMAVVSFVVTREGDVHDIKILRDPGDGCGNEAIRVVNLMKGKNMWAPGKKDGKIVAVQYNLPIRFTLKDGLSSKPDANGVYSIVEKMPYMESDECNQADRKLQKECGNKALIKFLIDNVKYPEEAKKNKTEGTAVVSFIISPEGIIKNIEMVKDLTDGCGSEAVRVINLMSQERRWIPGEKDGKAVAVKFNLPVRFKL